MWAGSATKRDMSRVTDRLVLQKRGRGIDNARVANSMNTLRHMGSWNLLALTFALGTSLAVAQEGQPMPKTQASKPALAAPVAGPPAAPAAAGGGVAQADE